MILILENWYWYWYYISPKFWNDIDIKQLILILYWPEMLNWYWYCYWYLCIVLSRNVPKPCRIERTREITSKYMVQTTHTVILALDTCYWKIDIDIGNWYWKIDIDIDIILARKYKWYWYWYWKIDIDIILVLI